MTRFSRIFLELVGPPVLGAIYYFLYCLIASGGHFPGVPIREVRDDFGLAIIAAGLVAGLPAIGFTIIMEVMFALGLDPRSARTVWLAALLGLAAGFAVNVLLVNWAVLMFCFFLGLGLSVGATIGFIIKTCTRPPKAQATLPPATEN